MVCQSRVLGAARLILLAYSAEGDHGAQGAEHCRDRDIAARSGLLLDARFSPTPSKK